MKTRGEHSVAALLISLAFSASGCWSDPDPCFGLQRGELLEVHIVDEYSAAAGYDFNIGSERRIPFCPASLRFAPGSSFDVRVVGHEEDRNQSCKPSTVAVTEGINLDLGAPAARLLFGTGSPGEIVHATHELTLEGCAGNWGFAVEARSGSRGEDGDAFVAAPSSGYPPIIMHLGFKVGDRESAACSQLLEGDFACTDYYVVELSRP